MVMQSYNGKKKCDEKKHSMRIHCDRNPRKCGKRLAFAYTQNIPFAPINTTPDLCQPLRILDGI
jgi:hypothetical protein